MVVVLILFVVVPVAILANTRRLIRADHAAEREQAARRGAKLAEMAG